MEIIIIAVLLVANLCIGIYWARELRKINNHYILYCKARIIKGNYGNGDHFNWVKFEGKSVDDNSHFLEQFNANEEVEIYIRRK